MPVVLLKNLYLNPWYKITKRCLLMLVYLIAFIAFIFKTLFMAKIKDVVYVSIKWNMRKKTSKSTH